MSAEELYKKAVEREEYLRGKYGAYSEDALVKMKKVTRLGGNEWHEIFDELKRRRNEASEKELNDFNFAFKVFGFVVLAFLVLLIACVFIF